MSRGGSYGGGHSSLGYLFGSDDQKAAPPPQPTVLTPPYGIDTDELPKSPLPDRKEQIVSKNHQKPTSQTNIGNFITDRPSTRVKSVPGGDSSLGYLFGDK